ncbi:MAG: HD domain-containing protein [bacterium]
MIAREEVVELFGSLLERIRDEGMRDKTVDAWLMACEEGGWEELAQVRRMPFTLLTDCGGIGFIEHTLAVTWGALGIAEGQQRSYETMPYEVDRDRLIAGGLLHDVGKLLEIERWWVCRRRTFG